MQASDTELCCICFEQVCTIEVLDCGHQMCAQCTLALCCHNKPNPTTACLTPPVCPFCRSTITRLVVAKIKNCDDTDQDIGSPKQRKSRKSQNLSEGSSSFKGISATFGKMGGLGSGRIAAESEWVDKPWKYLVVFGNQRSQLAIKDSFTCDLKKAKNIKESECRFWPPLVYIYIKDRAPFAM